MSFLAMKMENFHQKPHNSGKKLELHGEKRCQLVITLTSAMKDLAVDGFITRMARLKVSL